MLPVKTKDLEVGCVYLLNKERPNERFIFHSKTYNTLYFTKDGNWSGYCSEHGLYPFFNNRDKIWYIVPKNK